MRNQKEEQSMHDYSWFLTVIYLFLFFEVYSIFAALNSPLSLALEVIENDFL